MDRNLTLPAARSSLIVYLPMGSLCRTLAITCCYVGWSASFCGLLPLYHPTFDSGGTTAPKSHLRDLSISLSRMSMEHPESIYLLASASQIHWSLVLEPSFNLGSMIFQFIHLSKVPSVCLFLVALALEVATDVMETESKSLSSK